MSKSKTSQLPVRMVTPKFRVSFPHLFKVRPTKDGKDGKFEITMLFPKNQKIIGTTHPDKDGNTEEISLAKLLKNAKILKYGEDESKWPKNLKTCVQDGNDEDNIDKEGFKDHWVIKATSHADAKPSLVDKHGKAIVVSGDFYPGCFARASVYAKVWEHETGGEGVRLVLDHVQKLEDGKPFGGRRSSEQVFGPVNAGADDADEVDDEAFA
jgi:hypothetical protein